MLNMHSATELQKHSCYIDIFYNMIKLDYVQEQKNGSPYANW
jgi:hypothetical protein